MKGLRRIPSAVKELGIFRAPSNERGSVRKA